jgi:hypothetical protein
MHNRAMLQDALKEMIMAYQQQGKEIPPGNGLAATLILKTHNP